MKSIYSILINQKAAILKITSPYKDVKKATFLSDYIEIWNFFVHKEVCECAFSCIFFILSQVWYCSQFGHRLFILYEIISFILLFFNYFLIIFYVFKFFLFLCKLFSVRVLNLWEEFPCSRLEVYPDKF